MGAALLLLRLLRTVVPGLEFDNPRDVWLAAGLVTAAAAIACWIPSRRATMVDPLQAIRAD
jgi:ABC-type lipoprotein release transport system permease subunit